MTRSARFKVVLMWLPERLKEETANKLLKLVEEPFADTIFVMVSNNASLILPTIYSRTQRLQVLRFTDDELRNVLVERGMSPCRRRGGGAPLAEGSVTRPITSRAERAAEKALRHVHGPDAQGLRPQGARAAAVERRRRIPRPRRRHAFHRPCHATCGESFIMHLRNDELLTLTPDERAFATRFHPFINEKT